jgi:hypothetical protein
MLTVLLQLNGDSWSTTTIAAIVTKSGEWAAERAKGDFYTRKQQQWLSQIHTKFFNLNWFLLKMTITTVIELFWFVWGRKLQKEN